MPATGHAASITCVLAAERAMRKREILALVAAGCSNKEIAVRLGVTSWAIEKHLRHLFRRYRVPNRAALVGAALLCGDLTASMLANAERERCA